jgi:hypothetical protein
MYLEVVCQEGKSVEDISNSFIGANIAFMVKVVTGDVVRTVPNSRWQKSG